MEAISNTETNNIPKVNYDDKKYDVFFSFMVTDINPEYLDEEGKIELVAQTIGDAPFKCFSIQIANRGDRKLYTETFGCPFGYEFDINDRSFNVKFGGYNDLASYSGTERLVKEHQSEIKDNQPYMKYPIDDFFKKTVYIENEELNRKKGQDIRDVMVPKIISRWETAKEVADQELDNKDKLTTDIYQRHKEKNSSHNSSFTEDDYGSFISFDEYYYLNSMALKVCKNKEVYFESYNEVGASPNGENQAWVLPKRLIFNTNFFDTIGTVTEANIDEYISEFCEANKIYKSDIRIIDKKNRTTQVVSPRQFKDILMSHKDYYNKLTQPTRQKLDEMVQICEQNNGVEHVNNGDLYEQKSKTMNNNNVQMEDAAKSKYFNI